MCKMKKAVAIVLAAAMTMGSTLTVFATDETSGAGGTSGKGESEGHVDMEVVNVVLPTVPEGDGSPFEYIADPERLIQSTAGARYAGYTFPADKDADTGVYFRVGEKAFDNKSETLKVINKSSCNVTVTVTATARQASDKDLVLATSSTTSKDNPLYLNMKVGQEDAVVSASGATVSKTIAGNADNFEVQYTDSGYGYVAKDSAYSWKALEISMNGAVSKDAVIGNDTTAPTLDVTWAFAKAADASADDSDQVDYNESANPGIVSISKFVKTDPQPVVIKFSLGLGAGAVNANGATLTYGADKTAVPAAKYAVDMTNKTVTIQAAWVKNNISEDTQIQLTLTKGSTTVKTIKGTISVLEEPEGTEPEIVSISTYNKTNQNDVVITFTLGDGAYAVDADGAVLYQGESKAAAAIAKYTVDMAAKTVTITGSVAFLKNATADVPVYVVLTKGGEEVKELSGTITVN